MMRLMVLMRVRLFVVKLQIAYTAYNGGQGVNSGLDCGEPFHITEGSSGFCRSQLAPRTREIPQILSLALIEKGGRTTHHVSNEVMECGWGATPAQHTVNYGIKSQRQLHWIKLVFIPPSHAPPPKEREVGWSGPCGNSFASPRPPYASRMHDPPPP